MPTETVWRLRGSLPSPPTFDQLHGALARSLDTVGHRDQDKGWALRPLTVLAPDAYLMTFVTMSGPPPVPPAGGRIRLGRRALDVRAERVHHTTWQQLREVRPLRSVRFVFESPTFISRNGGRHLPLPDPERVFGGLARRWNLHAPEEFGLPTARVTALLDAVEVVDHEIACTQVPGSDRPDGPPPRRGFVGGVRFKLHRPRQPDVARDFAALAQFATLAGVGAETTHGFGTVTLVR